MYWLLDIFGFIIDVYRCFLEKTREVLGYVFIVNLVLKIFWSRISILVEVWVKFKLVFLYKFAIEIVNRFRDSLG